MWLSGGTRRARLVMKAFDWLSPSTSPFTAGERLIEMTRWQPLTLGDLLRRIAFDYVRFGYYRYAVRSIPEGKDLVKMDEKLRRTYGVTSCRTARMRQRKKGRAVVEYLRWHHTFILLATDGEHKCFSRIRSHDIRDTPLHLGGYSVGLRGKTVSVEVSRQTLHTVKRSVKRIELTNRDQVEKALASIPWFHFPGVVAQQWKLLRQVNQRRKAAGLPEVALPRPSRTHRRFSKSRRKQIGSGL